ncbi:hypothetical protein [Rothia kristinae]|uniref:hypothetical protein n=1 Tax=Rothia kristinae TaxID=37923 RepID=UPI0018CAFEA2|nr:hypothetical protein [Rothia kristinae]
MGLTHPADLRAWHRWQARRNLPRTLKTAAARGVRRIRRIPEPQPRFALHVRGEAPELLVALETTGPTQRAALLEPLTHLSERDLAVLAPHEVTEHLPGGPWRTRELTGQQLGQAPELRSVRRVLGVGSYLPVGAAADAWREQRDLPFWVVQHGLLCRWHPRCRGPRTCWPSPPRTPPTGPRAVRTPRRRWWAPSCCGAPAPPRAVPQKPSRPPRCSWASCTGPSCPGSG